jgi:hypothetical protein
MLVEYRQTPHTFTDQGEGDTRNTTNMAESGGQQHGYPSPTRDNNALPFYQQGQPPRPRSQSQDGQQQQQQQQQQHDAAPAMQQNQQPPLGDQNTSPEDAQLRASLTNVMSGYTNYNPPYPPPPPPAQDPQQQQPVGPTGLPMGSVAFAQATGSPDSAPPNPLRQKERTKVSRACDECRRKKIRCDAVDETGATPCSNCARTGARCAFSRQPMKRGPSKGYIKELAERLNTLESQVHSPHTQQQARYELQQVQQAMAAEGYGREGQLILEARAGQKRPFDVAEALQNGGQAQQGAPPAQMQSSPQTPMPPNPFLRGPPQQDPNEMQPFWRLGASGTRPESIGQQYETMDNSLTATTFDWDEAVVDEYYRHIHQTFPLLPSSKQRLRQKLGECPASLREACLAALDCLMRTFPTTALAPNPNYPQALKKTAELLARYPFDNPSTHTNVTNLVYLQTLLLMALECDNHGPATMRGQAGPSRSEWLGRAAGVAGQLEINIIRPNSTSVMEGDRDSEERLARRVWWVLFILDRWHASSTADLLKLPENSVILLPEDQILLGESTYHLARLSFIIGHLATILTTTKTPSTDVMSPSNPASSLLALALTGEIDRFRESVESVWGSLNLVHLSYHHCHLLIKRLNPQTEPTELVGHAVKVATVLNSRMTPVTPLNHHFGALAAMTLCELCDIPRTRAEAIKGLDQIAECLGDGKGLAGKQDSEGWDGAVRELVQGKRERVARDEELSGGLQGLAEAATTTAGAAANNSDGYDPTALTRYGYLTALGQGVFKSA